MEWSTPNVSKERNALFVWCVSIPVQSGRAWLTSTLLPVARYGLLLKKRKKLFFIVIGIILSTNLINLSYRRIFRPVYRGSFSILINDPFVQSDKRRFNDSASLFESIAFTEYQTDSQ